jgi:hypothetical protein
LRKHARHGEQEHRKSAPCHREERLPQNRSQGPRRRRAQLARPEGRTRDQACDLDEASGCTAFFRHHSAYKLFCRYFANVHACVSTSDEYTTLLSPDSPEIHRLSEQHNVIDLELSIA